MLLNEKNISGVSEFCRCFVLEFSWSFTVWLFVKATGHKPSWSGFQPARSDRWSCWCCSHPDGVGPTCPAQCFTMLEGDCSRRALRHPFGKNVLYCMQRRRKRIQILKAQGLIVAWHIEHMWPDLIEVLTGLSYYNWNFAGHPNQWKRSALSRSSPWTPQSHIFIIYFYITIYYYCLRHVFGLAMSLIIKKKHIFCGDP